MNRVMRLIRRAYLADFASDAESEWYANSTSPRAVRRSGMRFRVGDIFFNPRQHGRFGVVIGWDDRYRGPFEQRGRPLYAHKLYMAHYAVLQMGRWEDQLEEEYLSEADMLSFGDVCEGLPNASENDLVWGHPAFRNDPCTPGLDDDPDEIFKRAGRAAYTAYQRETGDTSPSFRLAQACAAMWAALPFDESWMHDIYEALASRGRWWWLFAAL
jgi:hypothetical protein